MWRTLSIGDPLPAGLIIGAARADLTRRTHNTWFRSPPYHRYAFLRAHVKNAKSVADILRAALADVDAGLKTTKRQTYRLYQQREALALAGDFVQGVGATATSAAKPSPCAAPHWQPWNTAPRSRRRMRSPPPARHAMRYGMGWTHTTPPRRSASTAPCAPPTLLRTP